MLRQPRKKSIRAINPSTTITSILVTSHSRTETRGDGLSIVSGAPIRPFQISIPDSRLERLHQKLALTDSPSELESDAESPWSRGAPTTEIRRLVECWRDGFNWRKAEAFLNDGLPQSRTKIKVDTFGSYDIHFVHLRSKVDNAIPLLFLHGWPGNFMKVLKIAHPLADGDGETEPAFHVVALSLVYHGFFSGSRTVCQCCSHCVQQVLTAEVGRLPH